MLWHMVKVMVFSRWHFHRYGFAQWRRQELVRGVQNYMTLFVPHRPMRIIHWTRFM